MRFIVEAQLPPALATGLRGQGHHASHVADLGLLAAGDCEIAARAEADGAVLVTKDEDFVTLRLPDRFSLLWLRCGNTTDRALMAWLEPRWERVVRLLAIGEGFIEVR